MVFAPLLYVRSGGVDEDELRILLGRDGEFGFVDGGDAVADRNPLPVDEDHALGWGEIGVPEAGRRVGESGPGKERRAQDPRVGADRKGLGVLRVSARERNKRPARSALGNLRLSQRGVPPRLQGAARSGTA